MAQTPKTLAVTECHRLLDALLVKKGTQKQFRKGIRNFTMALLMLETGLRVGEVVQLEGWDIYFNCEPVKSIIVRPQIAKNHAERQIPVSTRLFRALSQHFEYLTAEKRENSAWFVFHGCDPYRPMTTRQVERIIFAAAMKALGRPIHPHILRHTFGTRLMRITDMRTVQLLLGHKHISSTQVYTHPNSDDLRKAIDSMENSIGDVPTTDQALPLTDS